VTERRKWWGWGREGERYHLPAPGRFWSYLEEALGDLPAAPPVPALEAMQLPPTRLSQTELDDLAGLLGKGGASVVHYDRLMHARGMSYPELLRLRQGEVAASPDAVVYPDSEKQVRMLLARAVDRGWAVIPYGGGTSVVGGVAVPGGERPVLTMDLRRMNRILEIDRTSRVAAVQCGISGPELEAELNREGFTLGHFPQSFEHSTLGGWIATRAAGQNSTLYGKIEHMVVSLRLVTPSGILETARVPAEATGPSLLQWLIGSEGILGVITQAVVRLHPVPARRGFFSCLFPDFPTGMAAVGKMMETGPYPAVLRLSDPDETAMALMLSRGPRPSMAERLGEWYVRLRGVKLDRSALLIMIFEGDAATVKTGLLRARRASNSGVNLGARPARHWMETRFRHPYLRDLLMERSVLLDTLETAAPWEGLPRLYKAVTEALRTAILQTAPGALVLSHLSHAYRDGASLYFIFMARQRSGSDPAQWRTIKEAATEAILDNGGALSHHHGIGTMHKPWLPRYLRPEGFAFLEHAKRRLDPCNTMNPGKLVGS
jgi:alkyldihydroxyacetonephosphate synthase